MSRVPPPALHSSLKQPARGERNTSFQKEAIMNSRWKMLVLLAVLVMGTVTAHAGPVDIGKDGANKVWNGVRSAFGLPGGSIFGWHEKVEVIKIGDKHAFLLDLRNEDGSRCTLDFSAPWGKEDRFFKVYFLGVDPHVRAMMSFQRKGNKKATDNFMGSDSDRGSRFRHGDRIMISGSRNYLAQRNLGWSDEMDRAYPVGSMLFLEDGLTIEQFYDKFSD